MVSARITLKHNVGHSVTIYVLPGNDESNAGIVRGKDDVLTIVTNQSQAFLVAWRQLWVLIARDCQTETGDFSFYEPIAVETLILFSRSDRTACHGNQEDDNWK